MSQQVRGIARRHHSLHAEEAAELIDTQVAFEQLGIGLHQAARLEDAGVFNQAPQAAQLLRGVHRRFPVRFLRHILPHENCGTAEFRCKLAALGLGYVADHHARSFRAEQARLGRTLVHERR